MYVGRPRKVVMTQKEHRDGSVEGPWKDGGQGMP